MKKMICRFLVLAMILTTISVPMASDVSAAETDNVVWEVVHNQVYDNLSALTSDDTNYASYQTSSATLENDSTGGKYVQMTTSTDEDPYGLKILFPDSSKVDVIKLEYKVKIINADSSWWPISEKITPTGTGRAWALRLADGARYQIYGTDKTDISALTNTNGWFTVSHEYNNSTKVITTSFTNPDGVSKSGTKTFTAGTGGLDAYWIGCQTAGTVAYDDIKISYGYNKPEDFEENFNNMTELTAKNGIAYNVVENIVDGETVKSVELVTEGDNKYIKVSPKAVTTAIADASGSTEEWCVNLSAFDAHSIADNATLSFKIKFTDDKNFDTSSTNKFDAYQALSNKVYANGNTRNWSVRISPVLLQFHKISTNTALSFYPEHSINETTKNMESLVAGKWYTIKLKYGVDKSGETPVYSLVSSILDENNKELAVTEESVSGTGPITSYVFGVDKCGRTTCIDDIKVTYSYDAEAPSPVASVKVYADNELQSDLANVSMLTDKVVVSFSEAMNRDSVNENTVYIENEAGNKVSCGAELDNTDKIYTMTIPSILKAGTYKVVVTADALSAMDAQATAAEFEFTVSEETPALPEEDYTENFILNFDNMEEGAASDIDGVIKYNTGVGAKIVSGGVTGNCLSVTPKNSISEKDGIGGANNWSVFFNKIDTDTNANQVKIEYDVKLLDTETASSAAYGGYYAADKEYSVKTGTTRAWANRIGTINSNLMESTKENIGSAIDDLSGWIKVTYLYDKATNTMTGSYSQNGVTINSGVRDMSKRGMVKAFILGSADAGEEIYLDNFAVTYIYNNPSVTAENITISDVQGNIQNNWNNLDLRTKNIKIDFGAVMDTATLNNTNVYLSKDGGVTKVAYVPSYEEDAYVMSIVETLEKNTKYTLYVSKDVANVKGVTLDEAVSFEFTTGKGIRRAELMAVKVGDKKVTSVNELMSVTKAKVEVDYSNTTGEDQKINIIIAFYAGNTLKTVEIVEPEIDGDVVSMTYIYDFNLPTDMSDVTSVKVMAWSSFGEMIPLSDSIEI